LVVASEVGNPPIPLRTLRIGQKTGQTLGPYPYLTLLLCFINRLKGDTPDLPSRGVPKMGVASGGQLLAVLGSSPLIFRNQMKSR
jgi:hypothetical protein